jgi:hypothetical protein
MQDSLQLEQIEQNLEMRMHQSLKNAADKKD